MALEPLVSPAPTPAAEDEHDYLTGAIERLATRGERLVLSVAETAGLLGISRGLAYELARRGEIPTMKLGRRKVVPRAALTALIAKQCSDGNGGTAA